ncbi:hypothetical protein TWF506_005910 [Arthrobotrys conoides]|uniref:Tyrosinase copper-binding domain-containing protein n=1 Tax=Arthrobotrys conoides TaxID=74498 RepID=A0AAN8NQ33_9PEZI
MAVMSVAGRRIMYFVTLVLLLCSTGVFSVPTPAGSGGSSSTKPFGNCNKFYYRKEWRTLSYLERFQFLMAMNCIISKTGKTLGLMKPTERHLYSSIKTRYDDLVATHINQTFDVHYVGHFLPFHRYYTWTLEKMLRDEAGYTGPFPYWDWHRDFPTSGPSNNYAAFINTPMWDAVLGFGGNGGVPPPNTPDPGPMAVPGRIPGAGGCVTTGAFKTMTVNLGPGNLYNGTSRCLSRDFAPYFASRYLAKNQTKVTLQTSDYGYFQRSVEGGPSFEASGIHGGGHYGIGGNTGTMGDLYISPGDPAFWPHHSNLDRVWWSWQKLNPARLTDMSGPSCLMDYYVPGGPPQRCANVTLDQPLNLGYADMVKIHVGVKVRDIMNVRDMCYDYDELLDINGNNIPNPLYTS